MNTLSFLDLFTIKEKLDIVIPMLQRDYAQGREDAKTQRIRERFLDTLIEALEGKPVVLDFIYGSVTQDGKFYPLDGQQRLTTLFLLHGYIAARENKAQDFLRHLSRDGKSRFSYATRFSSRDFCGRFVDCLVGENLLFKGPAGQSLRSWIEDQGWFQYSWKGDPTIAAMLVMLDAIHERLKDKQGHFWPRLTGEDGKPAVIQFHFLELEEFELGDELYIKMNARGKPLTEFENLKAYFLSLLDKINVSQRHDFEEQFANKFDNDWMDIFWPLSKKDEGLDVDDLFLGYIRYLTDMFRFRHKVGIEPGADQDDFKVWNAIYGPDCDGGKEARRWLFDALDCWRMEKIPDVFGFFNAIFSPSGYEEGKIWLDRGINLFSRCCREYRSSNFTLGDSLLLYAILCRLVSSDSPREILKDKVFGARLRSVRNLIWQDPPRLEEMPRLLSVVKKIMEGGMLQEKESFVPFTEYQIKEEQAKAEFLEKNPEYRETVCRLEDHPLLRGRIAVLFDTDKKEFIVEPHRALTFLRFFPRKQGEGPSRALLAQALLAVGDYAQALTSGRWQFGPGNEKHEDYWRKLLTSQERAEFKNTRDCLCTLLKEISETSKNGDVVTCLERRVKEYLENAEKEKKLDWRYYFVKYYKTICAGEAGIYYCGSKSGFFDISMLKKEKRNGYNCDPYLWTLLKTVFPDKESPWDVDTKIIDNFWVRGGDKGWMRLVQAGVEMRCDPDGKGFLFKAASENEKGNNIGKACLDALKSDSSWKNRIEDKVLSGAQGEGESCILITLLGERTEVENYDTEDRIEIGVELVRRLLEV